MCDLTFEIGKCFGVGERVIVLEHPEEKRRWNGDQEGNDMDRAKILLRRLVVHQCVNESVRYPDMTGIG